MAPLYTVAEIVKATGGRAENVDAPSIASISIDSRELGPDALFVAIKGDRFDGHDFVAQAIAAGAVAALVSASRAPALAGLPLIVVEDALEGLSALARFSRERSSARIVAVTGSVGKTTTKEAIRAVFEAQGRAHASIRSFNNHWGVPLMLARMPADIEYAVFEIGMSAPGEITPLSRLVRPHVALITTVAEAHLEFFGSLRAIADAKAEILAGVEPGGLAILGRDHEQCPYLVAQAQRAGIETQTYGFTGDGDFMLSAAPTESGIAGRMTGADLDLAIELPVRGRHMLANAAAAILTARACGISPQAAAATLAAHTAPEGRGAAYTFGPADAPLTLIDESYNANPASMRAALEVVAGMAPHGGRKILVLGDMLELGDASQTRHTQLQSSVLLTQTSAVYLVGNHIGALAQLLPHELVKAHVANVDEITAHLVADLAYGDLVMVKGSNGVRLGTLVKAIRERFGR